MSTTPPGPLHQRRDQDGAESSSSSSGSQQTGTSSKLQIRVVPYSPPRLSSSDGSAGASSRPNSHAGSSPLLLATPSRNPFETPDPGHAQGSQGGSGGASGSGQELWGRPGVSSSMRPVSSLTTSSAALGSEPDYNDESNFSSRASSPRPPSSSRRSKRVISVNSDKTFSLVPQSDTSASRTDSFGSAQPSSTAPSSSYGRVSSNVFLVEGRSSSPLAITARRSSLSSSPSSPSMAKLESSPVSASPWNYRMRGGMRKVSSKAPDSKREASGASSQSPLDPSLPPLPESDPDDTVIHHVVTHDSQSSDSASTVSDRTNYKIYGESSPIAPAAARYAAHSLGGSRPASSNNSNLNYQILGESSSENPSMSDLARPHTGESDANYVLHGPPSVAGASVRSQGSRLRSEYSQESLIVAPLRPVRQRSFEFSGVAKSRSRESLRRGSLTSLTNVLSQEATRALFAAPTIYQSDRWKAPSSSDSSKPHPLQSHPHQWSAPLSTVMSESEGSAPPSRSLSPYSTNDRRSSGFLSNHSRHVLSISSLGNLDEHLASGPSHSRHGSLDRPAAAVLRHNSRDLSGSVSMVRHHDEFGDGLADLGQLQHRGSRTRLASLISNSSSDRGLRSSASSRSLNAFSLPTWARLYYGSPERRFVIAQASSDSIRSLYNGSLYNEVPTRHYPILNRSPSAERFTGTVFNPRRRPRDGAQLPESLPASPSPFAANNNTQVHRVETADGPREITPNPVMNVARGMKKQTSSIWSPHLRYDRRASRYSIWEPPSVVWSTDGEFDWRRNQQIVLFVVGFIFPFAWMIAAFLPLPPRPVLEMVEHGSSSHLDLRQEPAHVLQILSEMRYNNARWWRNLNRVMAIVGVLIIGAVIALAVVGSREQWGSRA